MSSSDEDEIEVRVTRRHPIQLEGHQSCSVVEFEEAYRVQPEKKTIRQRLKKCVTQCCNTENLKKHLLTSFPFIQTLKSYRITQDLPNDLIAGVTVGIMMIPQGTQLQSGLFSVPTSGMAFGALSTLPPIVGLYISLFAPLTYFIFGTSRQCSLGCIAILSLMMASILDKYDETVKSLPVSTQNLSIIPMTTAFPTMSSDSVNGYNTIDNITNFNRPSHDLSNDMSEEAVAKRIEVAGAVTLVASLIIMVMGKSGFGFVITYMSNALITSFTVGVAVHVITSQLKNVFGLQLLRHTGMGKLVRTWYDVCANLGNANPATVIICVISVIIMYLVKAQINERFKSKMRIPVPIELLIVIAGTMAAYFGRFEQNFNVKVVGSIPVGVPVPRLPNLFLAKDYIAEGLIIALVAYAQTVSMSKTFGMKHNYKVNANQEMFAIGAAAAVCSIFSGFFTAASVSRSIVQDGAGGRTQVTSLVACLVVLLVIMLVGPYLYALPLCVLASIIIVNLRGMFLKLLTLRDLWRKSRYDCTVWILTFLSVVLLDTDIGLLIGVLVSLFIVVVRTQISSSMTIGIVSETTEYRSLNNYKQVAETPGIKVIRLDAPLYFPNCEMFIKKVQRLTGINPIKWKKRLVKNGLAITISGSAIPNKAVESNCVEEAEMMGVKPQCIILDFSGVPFLDMMGVSALHRVITEFQDINVKVFIAAARESIMGMLTSNDFIKNHGHLMYLTLDSAVAAATSSGATVPMSVTEETSDHGTLAANHDSSHVQPTNNDIQTDSTI